MNNTRVAFQIKFEQKKKIFFFASSSLSVDDAYFFIVSFILRIHLRIFQKEREKKTLNCFILVISHELL